MQENQKERSSRRKFLSLGLMGGAGLLTQKVEAMAPVSQEGEKVTMLTADGKLVEVSKEILEQSTGREKARNQDILNWRDTAHKTRP
jgi:hypothetical protein